MYGWEEELDNNRHCCVAKSKIANVFGKRKCSRTITPEKCSISECIYQHDCLLLHCWTGCHECLPLLNRLPWMFTTTEPVAMIVYRCSTGWQEFVAPDVSRIDPALRKTWPTHLHFIISITSSKTYRYICICYTDFGYKADIGCVENIAPTELVMVALLSVE